MPPAALSAALGMLLVSVIWGVNFSVMKLAMLEVPPLALTAIRFTVASVALWFVAVRLEPHSPLPWATRWRLAGLGVIGNTGYQLAWVTGLVRTTAGNSSLIIASTPVITALLSSAFGVERISRRLAVAISLGTAGVLLVIVGKGIAFGPETLAGDLLTLGAVVCWSVFTLGVHRVRHEISPLRVTAWTVIGGTPLLLLAGLPQLVALDWAAVSPGAWLGVGYATFLSLLVAYVVWNRSVRLVGGSRTALFGILVPLVALVAAALLLGERPSPVQLAGAGLILAGVVVNMRGRGLEG